MKIKIFKNTPFAVSVKGSSFVMKWLYNNPTFILKKFSFVKTIDLYIEPSTSNYVLKLYTERK